MKIRIKGSSIRYRLTKSEVETFCKTGSVSDKTAFNATTFTYELKAKEGITFLDADFVNHTITLFIPLDQSRDWFNNSQVGFQHTITLASGQKLSLLVEKDFVCLDEREEDQSDNYENPNASPVAT